MSTATQHAPASEEVALQHYAALGDGRSVALVAPDGTIAWWCVPSIDAPPLFDSLIDPGRGGVFQLQPIGPFDVERRYREDSNVLETMFTTRTGIARVTESMNSTLAGRLPWCELARRVEVLSGTMGLMVRVVFGTRADTVCPEGTHHQWRKVPPRQLSIGLVADERLGRATSRVEAS